MASIQTPQFQRLRRIRQLGFSEFVFPGATHSRFGHSIGVFHTARSLMRIIERHILSDGTREFMDHQARVALAAALVHDVGHGMLSHAFEPVGAELKLPASKHEKISEELIRDSEISREFSQELGSGFANDVADLIGRKEPGNLYDAVVSSQFDADRLDYMQRDRLMAGVQSSGIDLVWLLANLEVASVNTGADTESTGSVETLVLGPKAIPAAESYVLSLFHLYPNLYLHKTTRGAEMMFRALMKRLILLVRDERHDRTGLPSGHPIARFAVNPEKLENVLGLDDMVFWGVLPALADAKDKVVCRLATDLRNRALPICIDIRQWIEQALPRGREERRARQARVLLICSNIETALREHPAGRSGRIAIDRYERVPYKRYQDSNTPLNRILIRIGLGDPIDIAEVSPVIAAAEVFQIFRAYVLRDDGKAVDVVRNIMRTEMEKVSHGDS